MVFPKSVSLTDLLKAGKLVKPPATTALDLESFDVTEMKRVHSDSLTLEIEETRFSQGAFRDTFRATTVDKNVAQTKWVEKQYHEKASTAIKDDLAIISAWTAAYFRLLKFISFFLYFVDLSS